MDKGRDSIFEAQPAAAPPAPSDQALPPGTVLGGRFLLTAMVAQGGTSRVYRARDLLAEGADGIGQADVAVKVLINGGTPRLALNLARHEAWINRLLHHERIVRIHDFHRSRGACFLSMDWVSGESLAQRLLRSPQGRLPAAMAADIAGLVAGVLDTAHDRGVIHSDLKPGNILLPDTGGVMLIDFATARITEHGRTLPRHGHVLETDSGAMPFAGCSTAYASPDTLRDAPASARDDVYSLACILYEMLAGKRPFTGCSSLQALRRGLHPERPVGMGYWQWLTLQKGLALQGRRRFKSCGLLISCFRMAYYGWHATTLILALALLIPAWVFHLQGFVPPIN